MEQQSPLDHFLSFLSALIDPDLRFHPLYLLPFFAMAFLLYLYHRRRGLHDGQGFFKWLFPKDVYFHPSHITDIKLFLLGQVLTAAKAFNMIVVMTLFAGLTILAVGGEVSAKPLTVGRVLLVTIVITLIRDFCVYWLHRLHHELPVFWTFHDVHHSAEVMTPVTVYRKHPVYDLISSFVKNIFVGIFSGLALVFLVGQIQLTLIAGVNIFYFLFNALGSNFRHSHIWFSYGPFWERFLFPPPNIKSIIRWNRGIIIKITAKFSPFGTGFSGRSIFLPDVRICNSAFPKAVRRMKELRSRIRH